MSADRGEDGAGVYTQSNDPGGNQVIAYRRSAGSDDLSVFAVGAEGLALVDRVRARGVRPTSVAVHGELLYVLSSGGPGDPAGLHGFRVGEDGRLAPLEGSQRQLSRP